MMYSVTHYGSIQGKVGSAGYNCFKPVMLILVLVLAGPVLDKSYSLI